MTPRGSEDASSFLTWSPRISQLAQAPSFSSATSPVQRSTSAKSTVENPSGCSFWDSMMPFTAVMACRRV